MELLLNLLWLALALVALGSCYRVSRWSGKSNRSRAFVLTGCLLAFVFPVVSASDDLNALRTEKEEGKSSDPSVKKSTPHHLAILGDDTPRFAAAGRVGLVPPERDSREQISEYSCSPSQQAVATTTGSRAPPYLESFDLAGCGKSPLLRCFERARLLAAPQVVQNE
jgi:hypothetical protein